MVGSRWRWLGDGGAMLLRNAVLLGNLIAGGQAHCNGGFQVAGLAMVALCY